MDSEYLNNFSEGIVLPPHSGNFKRDLKQKRYLLDQIVASTKNEFFKTTHIRILDFVCRPFALIIQPPTSYHLRV